MFGFSFTEIIIFVAILVLLFGAKKIPKFVRGIGEGARSIKSGFSEGIEGKTDKTDKTG